MPPVELVNRFVVHDGERWILATYVFPANADQSSRLQTIVDAVDPAQTLTGLTLVNQELARSFVPQLIKGLAIGTLIVHDWAEILFDIEPDEGSGAFEVGVTLVIALVSIVFLVLTLADLSAGRKQTQAAGDSDVV